MKKTLKKVNSTISREALTLLFILNIFSDILMLTKKNYWTMNMLGYTVHLKQFFLIVWKKFLMTCTNSNKKMKSMKYWLFNRSAKKKVAETRHINIFNELNKMVHCDFQSWLGWLLSKKNKATLNLIIKENK